MSAPVDDSPGSLAGGGRPAPAPRSEGITRELEGSFETVRESVLAAARAGGPWWLWRLVALAQPLLGAAPDATKRRLGRLVGDPSVFSTERATIWNSMLNLILYPVALCALEVSTGGVDVFSKRMDVTILLGLSLASCEWMVRMRESIFHAVAPAEAPLRGSFYAPVAGAAARLLTAPMKRSSDSRRAGFDGYYDRGFDDKQERARRYGELYEFEEMGGGYLFRLELPRRVPPSSRARELSLPAEMPDYHYEIAIERGELVVRGMVTDPGVLKLTAAAGAFPPRFTTRVPLGRAVAGFRHRYRDKQLEVALPFAR